MEFPVTFEKWVEQVKQTICYWTDEEIIVFIKNLRNMSNYNTYDVLIKMAEEEWQSRQEDKLNRLKKSKSNL